MLGTLLFQELIVIFLLCPLMFRQRRLPMN
jgi:hypothetical protein